MKKLNNKGFTLTELIVVIAILGILSGVASASISQIFANQTRKFINECDAMLTRCRVETLSGAPANTYVEFRLDSSDGHYYAAFYEGGTMREEEQLKNKNVSCSYVNYDTPSAGDTPIGSGSERLRIAFNRSTGAMDRGTPDASGTYPYTLISQLNIGGHKINLVPTTGYHSIGG